MNFDYVNIAPVGIVHKILRPFLAVHADGELTAVLDG